MTVLYQDANKKVSVFQNHNDFSQSIYYQNNNWCLCGKPDWTESVWGTQKKPLTVLVVEPVVPLRPNECWGLRLLHYWGSTRLECRNESQFGWTSTLDDMLERFPNLHTITAIHSIAREHSVIRLVLPEQEILTRWPDLLDKIRKNTYTLIVKNSSELIQEFADTFQQFGRAGYTEAVQQHLAMLGLYYIGQIKKDFDQIMHDLFLKLTINNIDESVRRNQALMNQAFRPWIDQFADNRLMTKCHELFGTEKTVIQEFLTIEFGRRISESIEQAKQEIIDEFQFDK